MIFFGVTILGLVRHGIHFFSFFVPAGTPLALVPLLALIELISYFARAFSLGVRSNGPCYYQVPRNTLIAGITLTST